MEKIQKSEEVWRKELSEEQYRVLREQGTEPAFSGKYNSHKERGHYHCAACEALLFHSDDKYDSGSGWPSYIRPEKKEAVECLSDSSHGMLRTEVRCSRCGGHLGHVFPDGPEPTGERYCINSLSLDFKAES